MVTPTKKMSAPAPCTNHLIECEFCEPEQGGKRPVFWSYNLRAHHAAAHPSHPVPVAALVGDLERELVRQVGGLRTKVTAEQKRKLSAANAPAPAAAAPAPAATATPAPAPAAGPV